MLRSSNPVLGRRLETTGDVSSRKATLLGTSNKAAMLLAMVVATAGISWHQFYQDPTSAMGLTLLGGIGGLVAVLVLINKPQWAGILAPVYALLEGLVVGSVSAMYEQKYGGLVFNAVGLTFATMAVMLLAYSTGLLRATPGLVRGVVVATAGVAVYYIIAMVLGMFHIEAPLIGSNSLAGIGFSFFVTGLAAFNLIIDFAQIEASVNEGQPEYMEWYGAFGLVVTLIWMYLEMLRLLSKLRN
ncbi:MAG: Bax inhibitor-1/YccA family protein [Pseudomonadales bacterium]|nr:Bax inhibitor-1/YccA family protein [Pseudomonadales bacterium]